MTTKQKNRRKRDIFPAAIQHEVVLVRITDITPAPWNPSRRTALHTLKKLISSLEKIGLLYPILVTPRYQIIDGHRRWASAKSLGWTRMPCIIYDLERESTYASVNETSAKMKSSDHLSVWLRNKRAVPESMDLRFKAMQRRIGIDLLRKMSDNMLSSRAFAIGVDVGVYTGDESDGFLCETIRWFMKVYPAGATRFAMRSGIDKKLLHRSIKEGRELSAVYRAGQISNAGDVNESVNPRER